jgi:hypothetical protein
MTKLVIPLVDLTEMTREPVKSRHMSCNLFILFKKYIVLKKEKKMGVAETTPILFFFF